MSSNPYINTIVKVKLISSLLSEIKIHFFLNQVKLILFSVIYVNFKFLVLTKVEIVYNRVQGIGGKYDILTRYLVGTKIVITLDTN